jgi:tubby and related proteins
LARNKSGFKILHPSYNLFLEKSETEFASILHAKKKAFNKTANYVISLDIKSRRKDVACLGKLRSNKIRDRYYLYNDGENPKKLPKIAMSKIRDEHLGVAYHYIPCSIGKLRKVKITMPSIN